MHEYTVDEDDVYDASGKKLTGFLKKTIFRSILNV
jgi:hypothetical protein